MGEGAHRRPAGREPADVGMGVGEEKGATVVLFSVKAAPEVDGSGSSM
jgi:hypothetical protein